MKNKIQGFKMGMACLAGAGMLAFGAMSVNAAAHVHNYVEKESSYVLSYNHSTHTIRTEQMWACECGDVEKFGDFWDNTEDHDITSYQNEDGHWVDECGYCDYKYVYPW